MARLWHGGAESNTVTDGVEVTTNSGTVSISSTVVRSGSYAWRTNPAAGTGFFRQQIFASDTNRGGYLRVYLRIGTLPGTTIQILRFSSSANAHLSSIRLHSDGTLSLHNAAGTQVGSATAALSTGVWYRLELKNDSTNATGTIAGVLDGSQFASGNNSSRGSWARVLWGVITPSTTCDLYFDDVALNDDQGASQNSYPGSGKLIPMYPNAAGDSNQWKNTAGSAGSSSNYQLVDETTPNDATDYVQSNTLNNTDFYNLSASGIGSSDVVNVVTAHVRTTNNVADAATTLKLGIEKTSGGTVTEGSAITPNSTSWQTDDSTGTFKPTLVTYTDPDGAAWTQSTLDSAQLRLKITTGGTNSILVSSAWLLVDYTPAGGGSATLTPSLSDAITITENVSVSVSGASNTWSSRIQAWVYPGNPACNADEEYSDGRVIYILKPEYYRVSSSGGLTQLTVASAGCNGYSSANAADVVAHSTKAFVTVACGSATDMNALCSSSTNRNTAKTTLRQFCQNNGFNGVELDWESFASWTTTHYNNFKTFVNELATELHTYGLQLMVDGPPITAISDPANGQNLYKFKYEDLVADCDYLVAMAYDKMFDYGVGTSVAPATFIEEVCDWMIAKVADYNKIVIGLNSYGYHGPNGTYSITIDTKTQSATYPGYSTATRNSDYEMTWTNGGTTYFYQDTVGINLKRQLIEAKGIQHIAVWHLGGNDWFTGTEPSDSVDINVSVTDNLTITEAATLQNTQLGGISVSDIITITESAIVSLTFAISVSDAVTITESITRNAHLGNIVVSDALAITESVNVQNLNLGSISVFDAVTIADVPTVANATLLQVSVSDSVTITESVSMPTYLLNVSVSDDISISETVTVTDGGTLSVSVNDAITITDVPNINKIVFISVSDSVAITENVAFNLVTFLNISVYETVNITESTIAMLMIRPTKRKIRAISRTRRSVRSR